MSREHGAKPRSGVRSIEWFEPPAAARTISMVHLAARSRRLPVFKAPPPHYSYCIAKPPAGERRRRRREQHDQWRRYSGVHCINWFAFRSLLPSVI
ncbi:hypothetical protein ACFL0M_04155 [Thermodesulfobacteriota bacterium]